VRALAALLALSFALSGCVFNAQKDQFTLIAGEASVTRYDKDGQKESEIKGAKASSVLGGVVLGIIKFARSLAPGSSEPAITNVYTSGAAPSVSAPPAAP